MPRRRRAWERKNSSTIDLTTIKLNLYLAAENGAIAEKQVHQFIRNWSSAIENRMRTSQDQEEICRQRGIYNC